MTPVQITKAIKEHLQDVEVVLNHLSDANNLAGSDGEHVRALLAQTGLQRLAIAYDLVEQIKST